VTEIDLRFITTTSCVCEVTCSKCPTRHPRRHHHRQAQLRPSWWSSPSGPSQHQLASWKAGLHPRHRQSHLAPQHHLRSLRPRGHLLPHPPPRRLQRLWLWYAWFSSLALNNIRYDPKEGMQLRLQLRLQLTRCLGVGVVVGVEVGTFRFGISAR
jgi:hypothetical protein